MFSHTRRLLVALVLACSGVVLTQLPAHACKCVTRPVAQDAKRADAVFTGVLKDSRTGSTGDGGHRETTYQIEAEVVYKGSLSTADVEVTSADDSCSLGDLKADKKYLFFVTEDGADLAADRCGGTERATGALLRKMEKALGEGTELQPDQPAPEAAEFTRVAGAKPEELTRLAAPGVALVLLGLLGLVVVRRRAARG